MHALLNRNNKEENVSAKSTAPPMTQQRSMCCPELLSSSEIDKRSFQGSFAVVQWELSPTCREDSFWKAARPSNPPLLSIPSQIRCHCCPVLFSSILLPLQSPPRRSRSIIIIIIATPSVSSFLRRVAPTKRSPQPPKAAAVQPGFLLGFHCSA